MTSTYILVFAVAVGVAAWGGLIVFLFGPELRRWRKRRRLGGMIL